MPNEYPDFQHGSENFAHEHPVFRFLFRNWKFYVLPALERVGYRTSLEFLAITVGRLTVEGFIRLNPVFDHTLHPVRYRLGNSLYKTQVLERHIILQEERQFTRSVARIGRIYIDPKRTWSMEVENAIGAIAMGHRLLADCDLLNAASAYFTKTRWRDKKTQTWRENYCRLGVLRKEITPMHVPDYDCRTHRDVPSRNMVEQSV